MDKLKVSWTAGLDEEKAREVEAAFKASAALRRRLKDILESKSKGAADKSLSASNYESPSWAFSQADSVGYQRALKEVLSLIS